MTRRTPSPLGPPVVRALRRSGSRGALRRAKVSESAPALRAGAAVEESVLRNGMRVLVAQRPGDPVVASVLFYAVGARNECEREAGLSHFLEHMMFKGSDNFGKGEVDRLTTALGGHNNAFTGYDHTAYWFEFASDRWEQALDLELDRMTGLLLDPDEFQAERAVVLEELSMGEDDPWRVLARHVESGLFPRHPYGRPIIGFPDTLEALAPEDMGDYYRRFYHPGNATLVIAGDVTHRKALTAVRKRFAKLPAGPSYAEADCFRPPLEPPPGPRRVETRWDDEGRRLIMAWPTVPVATDFDYALDLLLVILASGRLARLQRRLVYDGGLASSVSASNDTRVEGGAFWLFAECAQGVATEELERVIDEELERLARERVRAPELRRAKAVMRSSEAFEGETVSDLAEELGEWAVDADWRHAFDGCERYERLTAEQLRQTAARFLVPERRTVGWCLPREVPEARAGRKRAARKRSKKAKAAKRGGEGAH